MRRKGEETDVMKTLVAATALLLSASAAMAEAPCQNPVAPSCQKACAVVGAKYVLAIRERSLQAGAHVQTVRADAGEPLASAQHLARLADLSLDYIDGLTVRQINGAIAAYCPR
jgi:hypothetical protein